MEKWAVIPMFEDFVLKDNKIYFDPNIDTVYVNTKMGKSKFKPRITKSDFDNIKILSAYVKSTDKDNQDMVVDILQSLKGKGKYEFDKDSYKHFIKRTAVYFNRLIKDESIDVVVTIKSSSALSSDIAKEVIDRIPYDVNVYDGGILKNTDIDSIGIKDDDRITPSIRKYLNLVINNSKIKGYFKVEPIRPLFRKFIKDFLLVDGKLKDKFTNKTVLIIDDFLTSGVTMNEAIRIIQLLGPKKIIALTMIK